MPDMTLTQMDAGGGLPAVEVLVTSSSAATLAITRVSDGRSWPVRGAVSLPAGGGAHIIDCEVPFGTTAVYQVQEIDAYGTTIAYTSSNPIVVDCDDTWVHQPLDPTLCARVQITGDSATDISKGFDGSAVWPDGGTVGVWVGSRRHGVQGLQLTLETYTQSDADALQAIFGDYATDQLAVICLRTPPRLLRIPRTLFLSCPSPSEADISYRYGGKTAQMKITGDETRPPAPGLSTAVLTYGDLDVAFDSYTARDAYYGSYLAQDRDYSKAGLASAGD